jgi:hypothetical protein
MKLTYKKDQGILLMNTWNLLWKKNYNPSILPLLEAILI